MSKSTTFVQLVYPSETGSDIRHPVRLVNVDHIVRVELNKHTKAIQVYLTDEGPRPISEDSYKLITEVCDIKLVE